MHAKYLTKQCTCPTGPFGPCDSCKSTTDAARLREAAQRLFSADSDYWFAIDHKPIAASDAQLLAHHVLATVLEDAHSWRATTGFQFAPEQDSKLRHPVPAQTKPQRKNV